MKFLKSGLSVALVGTGLVLLPLTSSATAGPAPAGDPSIAQMRQAADGSVRVTTESATGKVGFIAARGANADLLPDRLATDTTSAAAKASAYLDRFGSAFGAAKGELVQSDVTPGRYGWSVTFEQEYKGVPVFGATLKASLDKAGDLNAISGYAAPGLDLSVDPKVSAADAGARAVDIVAAEPPTSDEGAAADTSGIKAASTDLVVYRTGFLKGETGKAVLAYKVEVTNNDNVRDIVLLDAATNKPVNRYSTITEALDRELYETSPDTTPVWTEGDPFPGTLNEDQQNLVASAGESYWMFANTFGRDSYDGLGATMKTVNNDPRINCPNANWNGVTTNYCDGVTSDDVVSHEWGHAYTEYTSGLIYQYQSGALNESYSDVWGETLDQVNGREDEGETFDTKRPDGECDPTAAAELQVNITAPAPQAGSCTAAFGFGPTYTTDLVTTDVTVATDAADATGPSTTDGCTAFTNAAAIAGHYAYVDRGTCGFQIKANNAVAAGATGLIVGQSVPGLPTTMSGTSTIPATMVTQADGTRIKTAGTVTMTLQAEDISERTDSTRWLIGEKSEAFGGAIRDMWTPTCYGNPGKVTDAEYNCDPLFTDSGGVHGNSGVPNHAYALAVDGGEYNGETITGIGLDKAANIWWRAQTEYLNPASDFTNAADGLEQSCTDLVGQDINEVSTAINGTPTLATPITATDCDTIAAVTLATEMRTPPTQCNFQPLLDKNTPSVCGPGFDEKVAYSENFEDGLAGWTADEVLADIPPEDGGPYQGGFGAPWEAIDEAPEGNSTSVAYGPAPDEGDCSGDGENDFSSSNSITSPEITLPADLTGARMTFKHNVATEGGYDGGNVKVSLNGSDFTPVPAEAFTFNAPTTLTSLGGGNTSPLAGEPGFTGTDGGKVTGSWGESQVDLSALDAAPGDTMQIRFDIGRDGCGGIDGWYVDDVQIITCEKAATPVSGSTTTASTRKSVKFSKDFNVRVKVVQKSGGPAKGKVQIYNAGDKIGQGLLDDKGRLVVEIRKNIGPGKETLRVKYLGNNKTKPSNDVLTIRVIKKR